MITRRAFVGGAVAGLLAPRVALAQAESWRKRVVVVGAGLGGLTAALDLTEKGWDVVVLEARDRVGGRVHTVYEPFSEGFYAEFGGESIDEGHHALLALVRRFGLITERRQPQKPYDSMAWYRGQRTRLPLILARKNGGVLADINRYYDAEAALGDGVDPAHPERAKRAQELDATSADMFIRDQKLKRDAEFLIRLQMRALYAAEPRDLSLLFVAQQAAQSAKEDTSGEDDLLLSETQRIRGGNSQLPNAMAQALGERLYLNQAVAKIDNSGDRVRVITSGGAAIDAAWTVLATPPRPLRHITFTPALPQSLSAAIHGLDLGDAVKVSREYKQSFWTQKGYSGFTVTDLPFGVAWAVTDSRASVRGVVTQYITGDPTRQLSAAQHLADFDRVYPEHRGLATKRVAVSDWSNDRYTGGAYAVWKPGQMVPFFAPWQQGAGRIRFAGEHTTVLPGYMESAVRSGHRVAAEIGTPPLL